MSPRAAATDEQGFLVELGRGFRGLGASIRDLYASVDPRTAGLFRIALGLLMAADALRHWRQASWAYSNEGVLTNHFHLLHPESTWNFSILNSFSTLREVEVAFFLAVLCHLCLMVGWHSRLFAIVSFVIVTSIDNRLLMAENGGYTVANLISFYAMFLPIERRFSVDAWLASYRERKERSIADLAVRYRPASGTAPSVSLAALFAILNLALIYFLNVVTKSGETWKNGDAIHYVLWLNRTVTWLAVFLRHVLPHPMIRVASWSVLCVEALLVTLILAPHARRYTRPAAMVLLIGLHTTLGVTLRLGPFSWFLIAWSVLLLTPTQWADAEAFYRRRATRCVVVLDRGSPLAFHLGRVLARLDALDLLTFRPSAEDASAPELVEVLDERGRSHVGVDAARAIAAALPAGRWIFAALRVLSLGLVDVAIAWAPPRRARIAAVLGLEIGARGREARAAPSPLRLELRRIGVWAREILLLYVAACSILKTIGDNKFVPAAIKPQNLPDFVRATVGYPRIFQGWGMFAPNPSTEDGTVVVDAITIEGRHVDPFTGRPPELDLTKSDGLDLEQIRKDYFNRIRRDRRVLYREGLSDWIIAYPKRTGRPADEIVAFDAYWVRAQCPPPGKDKPFRNELVPLVTYRKPDFVPPAGQFVIPPEPRVRSAEHPSASGPPVDDADVSER
jgi:hypothetical protein